MLLSSLRQRLSKTRATTATHQWLTYDQAEQRWVLTNARGARLCSCSTRSGMEAVLRVLGTDLDTVYVHREHMRQWMTERAK